MAKKNENLEHSEGGATTRDDALDSGVPMLAGDPSEPVGPEDALGSGPKRGDYTPWLDRDYSAAVVNPDHDPSDPDSPRTVLVHQNPLAEQRGDEKGVKGGSKPLADELNK
ncbi:MAG: hypothetical protein HOQ27_15425 [Dermatophilaceae bacterium]|nr:hypothetical protein [Dermatophilaceae bacterium]NUR79978.1 hypothetical protein [Dermatophilaceae bacterium]